MDSLFYLVLSVPASLLNVLVLFTIWRKVSLQTPSNIHLFSLAISDFSMGTVGGPLLAVSDIFRWFNLCYVHFFVTYVTNTLGIVSFVTIQAQLPSSQTQASNGINLTLFKKTPSNLVSILLWFILSFSLYLYTQSRMSLEGYSAPVIVAKIWFISVCIICLNSLVNPIIYCWRMEEIRNGMKESFYILVAKLRGTA